MRSPATIALQAAAIALGAIAVLQLALAPPVHADPRRDVVAVILVGPCR